MSTKVKRHLPTPHHMTQAEVIAYLHEGVLKDAAAAGWLKPSARKVGRGRDSVFYATRDVEDVSLRIASGEYPTAKN